MVGPLADPRAHRTNLALLDVAKEVARQHEVVDAGARVRGAAACVETTGREMRKHMTSRRKRDGVAVLDLVGVVR